MQLLMAQKRQHKLDEQKAAPAYSEGKHLAGEVV
jgi:hypothetical protein